MASLAHRSPAYIGSNADTFDGMRWIEKRKPASMAGPGHLAFGLGRWACPGRLLAVAGKLRQDKSWGIVTDLDVPQKSN